MVSTRELSKLLDTAKEASLLAGEKILEIYNSDDFAVELKGDNSPLTKADKAAHEVIMSFLEPTGIPVLSEEGRDIPYAERRGWQYLWVVDPLDGTKEFIKRNGEFTVNIALIENQEPVLGVVYVPVTDKLYSAAKGLDAILEHGVTKVKLERRVKLDMSQQGLRVVASRSHLNDDTKAFLDSLIDPVIVSKGSSLKFMMLADSLADLYPRFAPTMEWDTAAAHAIILVLGGRVVGSENQELVYNKEELLNPYFRAE